MSLIQGLTAFTQELQKNQIAFGIIGGLAVFAYGGERTTFDIDFLIDEKHKETLKQIAVSMGLKIVNENPEVLQLSGSVQIDIIFARREKTQQMLQKLRKIDSFPYPVVAPEDLIGLKIQAFVGDRSREFTDKGDILTIFKNYPTLDLDKVKEYADIFNVWNEISDLKNRI
jgi:hypothetical protein